MVKVPPGIHVMFVAGGGVGGGTLAVSVEVIGCTFVGRSCSRFRSYRTANAPHPRHGVRD
jgi:hypothetical protein